VTYYGTASLCRHTCGKTSIDRVNPATLTAFIRVMNGTRYDMLHYGHFWRSSQILTASPFSITKRITDQMSHRQRLCRDTSEWGRFYHTESRRPILTILPCRFNIFYPDLIDKFKAPTYKIEKEQGTADTVLIRFIAGPPYEVCLQSIMYYLHALCLT
jgi:hypothetical protein